MIAETGLAALWLTAGLAAYQLVLMLLALRFDLPVSRSIRAVAVVQGLLSLLAFGAAARLCAQRHVGGAGLRQQPQR